MKRFAGPVLKYLPELPITLVTAVLLAGLHLLGASTIGPYWLRQSFAALQMLCALVLFMVPGALLMRLLRVGGDWFVRIATYFAGSVGLLSIPALAVSLATVSIAYLIVSYVVISMALAIAVLWREAWNPIEPDSSDDGHPLNDAPLNRLLLGAALVTILVVTIIAALSPIGSDDMNGLAFIQDDMTVAHINAQEPIHGIGLPLNSRSDFTTWPINMAMMTVWSGLDAVSFYMLIRPLLVLIALLAFYAFALRMFRNRNQALFSLIVFSIIVSILTQELDLIGFGLYSRIGQDKFLVRYVLMPLSIAWPIAFIVRPRRNIFILGVVMMFAAAATHTIGAVLTGIPLAGFGALHFLFNRNRKTFMPLAAAGAAAISMLALPLIQAVSPNAPAVAMTLTDTRDPALWYRIRLVVYNFRLLIMPDGEFIVHPRIFLQTIVIIPIIALPILLFLAWRRHSDREGITAQLIAGTLILEPILLEVPFIVVQLANRSTPWLLHRLAWPSTLVGTLALAWGGWFLTGLAVRQITRLRNRPMPRFERLSPVISAALAMVVLAVPLWRGVTYLFDLRADPELSRCLYAQPVASQLPALVGDGMTILSTPDLDFCIPMYAANGYPIEHYGVATISRFPANRTQEGVQRVNDVNWFTISQAIENQTLAILRRYNTQLVFVHTDHPAAIYMHHLPAQFQLVTSSSEYAIYRVIATDTNDPIVQGNTAISEERWSDAVNSFKGVVGNPSSGKDAQMLAYLGLGRAYLDQGMMPEAVAALRSATGLAPDEAEAFYQLGNALHLSGDNAGAAQAFRQAVQIMPTYPDAYQALADAERLTGQREQAMRDYQISTGQKSTAGGAMYDLLLGGTYNQVGWYQDALTTLNESLNLHPTVMPYLTMVQTYLSQKDYAKAEEMARADMRLEMWSDIPHLAMAQTLEAEGKTADAINSHREAVRLSPISLSHYALGQDLRLVDGSQAAEDELSKTTGFKLGFGVPVLAEAEARSALGQMTEAIQGGQRAFAWEPVNASAASFVGEMYARLGQNEQADSFYRKAIVANDADPSSYMGLSRLNVTESDWGTGAGWALQGMLTAPYSGDPIVTLGNAYAAQGDVTRAVQSYIQAAKVDTTNPGPYLALGSLYRELGQSDQAQNVARSAGQIPSNGLPPIGQLPSPYTGGSASKFSPQALAAFNVAASMQTQGNEALLQLGNLAMDAGDTNSAIDIYEKAIATSPYSGPGYLALARAFQQAGKLDDSLQNYQEAIKRDPGFALGYTDLGQTLLLQAHSEAALGIFQKAFNSLQWRPDGALGLGQIAEQEGRFNDAKSIYEQALTHLDPLPAAPIHAALAALAARQGDYAEAQKQYEQAIAANPLWLIDLGQMYASEGDTATAAAKFQEAVTKLEMDSRANAYVAQSNLALQQRQLQSAESFAQSAITTLPTGMTGYSALASVYIVQGRFTDSAEQYQKALAILPGSPDALIAEAGFMRSRGQWDQALIDFQKAQALAPGKAQPSLALGDAYLQRADYAHALTAYQSAYQVEPGNSQALIGLGRVAQALGKYDDAETSFRQAAALDATQANAWLALGDLDIQRNKTDDARIAYQAAITTQPVNPSGYVRLGMLDEGLGQLADAEAQFRNAIRVGPTSGEAYTSLGQLLAVEGKITDARATYRQANKQDPGYIQAYYALGQMELGQGNLDAAQVAFQSSITADASRAEGHIGLGQVAERQGDWRQSESQFRAGAAAEPAKGQSLVALAGMFQTRNDPNQAISSYQMAIDADPGYLAGYTGLANLYGTLNKPDLARSTFQAGISAQPASAEAYSALASYELLHGNRDAATSAFQQAAAIQPGVVSGYAGLAQVYMMQGQPNAASEQYKKAVAANPGSPDALIAQANFLVAQGQWDAARTDYLHAQTLAPGTAQPWLAYGDVLRARASLGEAKDAYQTAGAHEPGNPQPLIGFGLTAQAQGNFDIAESNLRKAASLDLSQGVAYQALGAMLAQRGREDDSVAAYRQAIAIMPANPAGYIGLGQVWASRARFNDAIAQFKSAIAVAPADGTGYVALGQTYEQSGDLAGAQAQYVAAYRVQQTYVPALTALGRLDLAQGKNDQALLEYQTARDANASAPEGVVGLSQVLIEQGKYSDAETQLKKSIAINPGSGSVLSALGNLYLSRNKSSDAISMYQTSVTADPGYILAYVGLGQAYALLAQTSASEAALKQAVSLAPTNAGAYGELAMLYANTLKNAQAKDTLHTAFAADPTAAPLYLVQGGIARQQGDVGQAISSYQSVSVATSASERAAPYLSLGDTYRSQAQWDKAADAYTQAAKIDVLDPTPFIRLGEMQLALAHVDQARSSFQSALDRDPMSGDALAGLGESYIQTGDNSKGIAYLQQAVQRDPSNPKGYADLADAYRKTGVVAQAEAIYKQGIANAPTDPANYLGLGALLQAQGRMAEAQSVYAQATQSIPSSGLAWTSLGDANILANRFDQAATDYQKGIAAEPTYDGSYQGMGLLQMRLGHFDQAHAIYAQGAAAIPTSAGLAVALGDSQRRSGDVAAARASYQQAIAMQPASDIGYVAMANFLMTQGDFTGAINQVATGQSNVPLSAKLADVSGDINMNRAKFTEAIKSYLHAIDLGPDMMLSAYSHLYDASSPIGKQDDVIAGLTSIAQEQLGSGYVRLGLGNMYRKRGDLNNAGASYVQGLSATPGVIDLLIDQGQILHLQNQWDAARQDFQKAIDLQPGTIDGYMAMGSGWLMENQTDSANASYTQAAALDASRSDAYVSLGVVQEALNNLSQAEGNYNKGIIADPLNYEPRVMLGLVLTKENRHEDAKRSYAAASAMDASQAKPYVLRGELYYQEGPSDSGDLALAESLYNKAIAAEPSNLDGYLQKAYMYTIQNRQEDAKTQIYTARNIAPASGLTYAYEANLWNTYEQWDAALTDAETAVYRDPTVLAGADYEIWRYTKRGDLTWTGMPAFRDRTQYYENLSNNSPALWIDAMLADMYQKWFQDEPGKAVKHLQNLEAAYPEDPDFHAQLAVVYEKLNLGEASQREAMIYMAMAGTDQNGYGVALVSLQKLQGMMITSPRANGTVSGRVTITGSASADFFQYYKLEFGAGSNPTNWTLIGHVNESQVTNGVLGTWDTSALKPGQYTLRLTVVDKRGQEQPAYHVLLTVKDPGTPN